MAITRAVTSYLVDRRYSIHPEIGVKNRRRLDILAVNMKGHVIGCEVKSCIADFRSDKKWREYLPYVNKLYFAFDKVTWDKHKDFLVKTIGNEAGIVCVSPNPGKGFNVKIVRACRDTPIANTVFIQTLVKMAWRSGISIAHIVQNSLRRVRYTDDPLAVLEARREERRKAFPVNQSGRIVRIVHKPSERL